MSAPELSAQERAVVDRIEQAPDALGLREEVAGAVRDLILANFTNGRHGYRLNPTKAAEDVLDFLEPIIERREAEAAERALRDAADEMGEGDGISRFIGMDDLAAAVRAEKRAQKWLRDRADRIGGIR